eukprot:scaffold84316_cov54-Attheya_sp.AAC.2
MVVEARHRPGGRLKSLSLLDATNTVNTVNVNTNTVNTNTVNNASRIQHTDTSRTSTSAKTSATCTSRQYNVAHVTGQGFRPNNQSILNHHPLNKQKHDSWIKKKHHEPQQQHGHGRPLDLGGQFIHGIRHNPIYSMTQTLGLTAHSMSSCQLLTRQGDILSAERDGKMEAAFNQVLSQTWHDCQTSLNQSTSTSTTTTTTPSSHSHSHSRPQEDEDSVTRSSNTTGSNNSDPQGIMSFGTVFERRARDMARTMEFSPEDQNVFQWHVTNLELSCGTSLDNLGYTWNDDEPYGYTGQHCLLEQSFGSLIQSLSHGIPIQYGCQVKHIQLVVAPAPAPAPSTLFVPPEPTKRKITTPPATPITNAKPPPRRRSVSASVSASKRQRQSARLTGDTSHLVIPREDGTNHTCKHKNHNQVRRSSRSHRQTPTRFTIDSLDAAYSYDNPQLTSSSSSSFKKKKPKTNARSIPTVEDLLQDDDEEDEDERTKVRVVLESGLVLEADAVVCTLPVGVLKLEAPHHPDAVTFDPPLPERKRLAIQRLGCGRFNKCALLFDRVFWQDSDFIGFTATPATHILVTNLCRPPAIRPTIPAMDSKSNQEDASSLSSAAAPILIMYYGGAHAHDMEELRDVQVVDDCMQVLRDNFGTDLVPDQPLDYAVTRWGMERFSRGAFSFVPPGVHGETELDLCGAPIYDPYQSNVNSINVVSPPASDAHPQQNDEYVDLDPTNSNSNIIAPNTSNTASSSSSFTANNHVPVAVGSALQHGLAGDSSKDPSKGKADGEHENEHDAVIGSSSTSISSSANAVAIDEQNPSMSEERNDNENDLTNIQRPVILFAGEHTTPYHPSTIHGAFSSGIREAYRLDVSWEPALNQNIQFDKTFLYQRTFPLKRKQRPKKEREQHQNTVSKKSPQPTSRIVTTEGGMKLRKRTAMIMNGTDNKSGMPSGKKQHDHHQRTGGGNALQMSRQPQQKAPEPQQSSSGVRRSNRQISRFLQDRQYKGDINSSCHHNNGAGTKKEQLLVDGFSIAEDICLLRAVDTFSSKDSDAWEQIRTKTFDETKSVAQLEARYKTLVEEGADLDPSRWNQLPSSSSLLSSLSSNNDKEYDEWSKANWSLPNNNNNETETWLAPKEVQPLVKAKQQQKALTSRETHPATILPQEVEQEENNNIRRSSRRRSSHWKYYDSSDE